MRSDFNSSAGSVSRHLPKCVPLLSRYDYCTVTARHSAGLLRQRLHCQFLVYSSLYTSRPSLAILGKAFSAPPNPSHSTTLFLLGVNIALICTFIACSDRDFDGTLNGSLRGLSLSLGSTFIFGQSAFLKRSVMSTLMLIASKLGKRRLLICTTLVLYSEGAKRRRVGASHNSLVRVRRQHVRLTRFSNKKDSAACRMACTATRGMLAGDGSLNTAFKEDQVSVLNASSRPRSTRSIFLRIVQYQTFMRSVDVVLFHCDPAARPRFGRCQKKAKPHATISLAFWAVSKLSKRHRTVCVLPFRLFFPPFVSSLALSRPSSSPASVLQERDSRHSWD
jgi:hypothetical protein